jgi:hypothetical protein
MKKNTIISLFALVFGFNHIIAQRNFRIQYDYANDKYHLKEEQKKNRSKQETTYEPVNRVKFKEGDIVKVEVINYNPLKYQMVIEKKEIRYQPITEPKVLGSVLSIFNQQNMISTFLGEEGLNLSSLKGRDEEEMEIHFANDDLKIAEYNVSISDFENHYKNVQNHLSSFGNIISIDLKKETFNKEDIISSLKEIRKELKENSIRTILLEGRKIQNLYLGAGVYRTKEEFLKKNNTDENSEKFEDFVQRYDKFCSSYKKVSNLIQDLEEIQNNPSKNIDVSTIDNLINTIENAEYTTEKTFVIHTNSSSSLRNTNPEGILTDLHFEVVVYDVQKLQELNQENEEITQYVKYPNDSAYMQPDGSISSKPCLSCDQLTLAEGTVKGEEIPSINEVLDGSCSNCVGKWIFYDDKGEILRIKAQPKTTYLTGKNALKSQKITLDDAAQYETAVKIKKSMKMPVTGALAMNWTTGIYAISPFSCRNSYQEITNGDSVQVTSTRLNSFAFSLGTLMSIDFLSTRYITPSINLGVSVDLLTTKNLNYLIGFSIKPKALPLLSISTGLAYTLTNQLNENIRTDEKYLYSDYQQLLNNQEFKKEVYKPGFFVGLNLNF